MSTTALVRRRPLLFAALGALLLAIPLLGTGELQCTPIPVDPPRDTHCDDGAPLECDAVEPTCDEGLIPAVQDGCWRCVDPDTCRPPRDTSCDDGTVPLCDMMPPVCGEFEILAYQDDCYRCVNPQTCAPWGQPGCRVDADCASSERCDYCGTSSCPFCDDCVAACRPHGCETEPEPLCDMARPECEGTAVAVVRGGCWVCVDSETCEPVGPPPHDPRCDDGTPLECDMARPTCDFGEVAAIQGGCWVCVNGITCAPWGEPGCERDADCAPDEYCNFCATGSCPVCLDCVAGCTPHGCPTEEVPACNMIRPDCEDGGVAVVRDGCWVCVGMDACQPIEPPRDTRCDDGTEPICLMIPPTCGDFEILAYQNGCYACVNPATCLPWGEPACRDDADCEAWERCDPCGTSSCPFCEDCVPACEALPD